MENSLLITGIIIIFLILIFFKDTNIAENLTNNKYKPTLDSHIKLYESFNLKDLAFLYQPALDYHSSGYLKLIVRVNLKSFDIKLLPYHIPKYDKFRRVEIWSIYDGENTASSESDFYSSYLDPHYAYRANPPKYQFIVKVLPGQHIKENITVPVKKIMLIAYL